MDDNFIERLRQEQRDNMENPRGCKVQMTEAGEPYPCAHNCPCALLDELLVTADRIKELAARAEAAEAKLARARRDGFNAGIKSAMGALMDADTIAEAGAAIEELEDDDE